MRRAIVSLAAFAAAAVVFAGVLIVFGADEPLESCCSFGPREHRWVAGTGFTLDFTIRNAGRLPLTVTAIPPTGRNDVALPFDLRGALLVDGSGSARPFEPFELGRGDARRVRLLGTFDRCSGFDANEPFLFAGKVVRYSVAGIERAQLVRFPVPATFVLPATCPEE